MVGSAGFRKYFASTGWLFADRVIRLGLVLVTGIFITRHLGAELFGQLNYATALVGLFFVLTHLGLHDILVRDLVRHPEKEDELMGTALVVKMVGGVVLVVAVVGFALLRGLNELTVWMVLLIASAELFKPFVVIEYWYLARVQGRTVAQVQIVQSLVSSAFRVVLIVVDAPLIWFAGSYIAEMVAYTIGFVFVFNRDGRRMRAFRYSKEMARYLLGQSWPLIIYGVALNIQLRLDQVMIFDILSTIRGEDAANAEVGQYSVALKMIEAFGFLPVVIQQTLAPAIARAKVQDQALYESRLVNQYRLMFLLFLLTAVPLFLFAQPLILLLFGEDFREAGYLLALFAMRLIFTFMGVAKTSFITNESLFKYSLLTAVVGAVINVTMNYLLIPTMGSIGAIWATMVSFFVGIFLLDLLFERTRPNFRWMMKAMSTFWRIRGVD